MKKTKKLLRTVILVLLVMFTLGSGMTVSAKGLTKNQKNCKKAFSSITLSYKKSSAKAPLDQYPDLVHATCTGNKVKVKVKLKKGWKMKKITYYDANKDKTKKYKNKDTVKLSKNSESYLKIKAKKGDTTATYTIYVYNVS